MNDFEKKKIDQKLFCFPFLYNIIYHIQLEILLCSALSFLTTNFKLIKKNLAVIQQTLFFSLSHAKSF